MVPKLEKVYIKYLGANWKNLVSAPFMVMHQMFVYLDMCRDFNVDEVGCVTLWDAYNPDTNKILYPATAHIQQFRILKTLTDSTLFLDELKAGGADKFALKNAEASKKTLTDQLKDLDKKYKTSPVNHYDKEQLLIAKNNRLQLENLNIDTRRAYAQEIDSILSGLSQAKQKRITKKLVEVAGKAKRNWITKVTIWASQMILFGAVVVVITAFVVGIYAVENPKVAKNYYDKVTTSITKVIDRYGH